MQSVTSSCHRLPRLPVRYVIADQHQVVSDGVEALLNECTDLQCVAHINDGAHFMDTLCIHKPDILITGLFIDGVSPLAVFRQCRQCMPDMGIIVLSMFSHPLAITESTHAGANAFLTKNESREQLLDTIFRVATGQSSLFPKNIDLNPEELSEREREVLYGIASGMTAGDIGHDLSLSPKTVEQYRTQLLQRFNVRKSTDLVRIAIQSGVVLNSKMIPDPLCKKANQCKRYLKEGDV